MTQTKQKIKVYEKRKETEDGAKQILKKLIAKKIAFLHVKVGGGKTFMSIRAVGAYCPNAHILILTTKKQKNAKEWENSISAYNNAIKKSNLTCTVINYESLNHTSGKTKLQSELKKHLKQKLYIIADEAQRLKNPKSKNFKHVKKLKELNQTEGLILLSGSPITEDLTDTCGYLILAGFYRNPTDFNRQHVLKYDMHYQPITKDRQGVIHNEWLKNHEVIIQRFKQIQVFIETSHLLPAVIHKDIHFEYPKEIRKEYNKIQKDYRNGIYESATQAIVAQREFVGNNATQFLKVMSVIIDNPKRKQAPILIFYKFNVDLMSLRDHIEKNHSDYDIFELNGIRQKKDKKFDTNVKPKKDKTLILCQYKAASEAFNAEWSYCSIFYGATYSFNEYTQGKGRNVRNGQKGTVYHFRFILDKTINKHYWIDLVDNKKKFTQALMLDYLTK